MTALTLSSDETIEAWYTSQFRNIDTGAWTPATAARFCHRLTGCLPETMRSSYAASYVHQGKQQPVLFAHKTIETLRHKGGTAFLDEALWRCSAEELHVTRDHITATGRPSVVFVAVTPYFSILRSALELRRQGYSVHLLTVRPTSEPLAAMFRQHFDTVASVHGSVEALRRGLQILAPAVYHVQCWMFQYWLGRMVIDNKNNASVVCEFYDITSLYAERDVLYSLWPPLIIDADLAMERYIFRHADAVITRFGDAVFDLLRTRHQADTRILCFWPYPCREFGRTRQPAPRVPGARPRVVFAGGIVPANRDHPTYLFPARGMYPAIRRLLAQDIEVTILHDPNRPLAGDSNLAEYVRLAEADNRFRLMEGVPPDRLADALVEYDFGMILFDMPPGVLKTTPELLQWNVGTKLLAYFEASIPVIVSAEYEFMARIVEENGLGFAVSSNQIDQVASRTATFDFEVAQDNLRRYNEDNGMHRRIADLIHLYQDLGAGC